MKTAKPKPGQANKDEIASILRALVPAGHLELEHRFHPVRMWRFDYAIPALKIAVEYHGHAGFVGKGVSGHSTIKGLTNDCEKLNAAMLLGWQVLAFTALHFSAPKRAEHKLRTPYEMMVEAVKAHPKVSTLLGIADAQPGLLL